jgi:CheY-like chemotaxis protein
MLVHGTQLSIFLVDDDSDDRSFMKEVFFQVNQNEHLRLFESGERMFTFLSGLKEIGLPSLIILDYHMPKLKGIEILVQLKGNERYRHIPVVIYSSEMNGALELQLMQLGAAGCYKKADGYGSGIELAKKMELLAAQCN